MDKKWRVAFLCRKNTCRSQIAEALGKMFASDVMECYSAGIEESENIKDCALRMMKITHGIDLIEKGQRPKPISALPKVDIIVYMGCNVECVHIPCEIEFEWGISDPCNKSDEEFKNIIKEIENNILKLRKDIISGQINVWQKDKIAVDFASVFPFWESLTDNQKKRISDGWRMELISKDRQIYRYSDGCKGLMIIRKGCLRVYIISDEGRDVTLYRLFPGDICVFSAACLIQEIDFDVLIEATEDTESVTIPAADLKQIMQENLLLENFIYKKTAERFSDVMWIIQQILFKKIDQRIAQYLWDGMLRQKSTVISVTHDNIARDIGSVREIVTKVLKQMAKDQIIKSGYGKIEILDKDRLFKMI
ncbi:helix-turn-helix domain-containing protein [Bariatricus sp. SGI.154]|uniref:arsenate reductase/protein-tyrosine-phosphatase family protein n=1 Tax=Bariatricus sp. SGI.154 TaxID=3420549 RepID=UPI003D02D4EB